MQARSSIDRFGAVAVVIHWLSVIVVFALLGSGLAADRADGSIAKAAILKFHAPLGGLILLLTLIRIVWWLTVDRKPPALPAPGWQVSSARLIHALFYIVLLGMAASGIGMFVLSGAGSIVFAGGSGSLPDFWSYAPRVPHSLGSKLLMALIVMHAGAALYHQFVVKDGLIKRMWF
jgi:cytochrome b561